MGSNGSVIPFFLNKRKEGVIPITDPNMTRFNISLEDGVQMVMNALDIAWGGELFVPKIPSYKITEVAKAIGPNCKHEVVGIRPGEKVHEEMITSSDAFTTYYWGILCDTSTNAYLNLNDYIVKFNAKRVPEGFNYSSGKNTHWVSAEELRALIVKHIDLLFRYKAICSFL